MAYFDEESPGRDRLRIGGRDELPHLILVDGVHGRPVVGERLLVQEVVLDPGAVAPVHVHDEEQIGYVVSGACEFTDGERTQRLGPGDWYHAPSGAPHGATGLGEGCVILDTFSPPRAQVLQMLAERSAK